MQSTRRDCRHRATHSRTASCSQPIMAMPVSAVRTFLRRAGLARHVARMGRECAPVLPLLAAPRAGLATAAAEPEAVSVSMETSPNMNSRIFNVSGVRVLPAHVTAGMVSCTDAAGERGILQGAARRVCRVRSLASAGDRHWHAALSSVHCHQAASADWAPEARRAAVQWVPWRDVLLTWFLSRSISAPAARLRRPGATSPARCFPFRR